MTKSKARDVDFGEMKILFLDIETTPNLVYAWGLWDQNISINQIVDPTRILCWSAKWLHYHEVMSSSEDKHAPEDMLMHIWKLLDKADVVVSYNGKKFDIPRLNNEFIKYGFPPPSPYKQIDLYRVVKTSFGLPSYKLEYVVKHFGLGKKVKTTGMDLWIGCMDGDKKSWEMMKKYNITDTMLTEKVYKHVLPWITNHPNRGLFNGIEFSCPNCGSSKLQRRGLSYTSTQIYQRYQCLNKKCGKWSRGKKNITKDIFDIRDPGSLRG